MSLYLILAYPHTCLWCKCQYKIVGFLSYKNVGKPTRLYDVLFAIAICCNYRFNLLHKCIIVILIVNSSKHWVTYNITISIINQEAVSLVVLVLDLRLLMKLCGYTMAVLQSGLTHQEEQ